jgi:RNA polymerase sigma-70 factor (ECF subfamily)
LEIFEALYGKYNDDVYRFLLKLTRDAHLAEELTQETFAQAFDSITKYKEKSHIKTWLIGIAKNLYFSYIRKHKRRLNLESIEIGMEDPCLGEQEFLHNAVSIISNMNKKMRDVMILRIVAGIPHGEIAQELGLTMNDSKVTFHRGKEILRNQLRKEYHYEL